MRHTELLVLSSGLPGGLCEPEALKEDVLLFSLFLVLLAVLYIYVYMRYITSFTTKCDHDDF